VRAAIDHADIGKEGQHTDHVAVPEERGEFHRQGNGRLARARKAGERVARENVTCEDIGRAEIV
jgi:hypothetical protein